MSSTASQISSTDPTAVSRKPPHDAAQAQTNRWFWLIVSGLFLLQAILAIDCSHRWAPTHDEYWHLPIGLRMWKSGRFDDDVINPPPVRLWAAIPLVLGGANPGDISTRLDVGDIGDEFWKANGDRARFWYCLGRLMIILLLSATGIVLVIWGRHWYGERSALVTALLWTCCPTVLANGSIVTHDLPLAAAWTASVFLLARFAERPSWRTAVRFGLALGIAPLTKLTGLILAPLGVLLWIVLRIGKPTESNKEPLPRLFCQWISALGIAVVVINTAYLFRGTGAPLNSLKLASSRLKVIQQIPGAGRLPVPLPGDFIAALDRLALDLERKHPIYLDGEWSDQPFAFYYAQAIRYKLPVSTMFLGLLSCAAVARSRTGSHDARHGLFLLISATALPLLASGSSNQIGIRYVLPFFPLICLFAGQSARWLDNLRSPNLKTRWVGYAVLTALVVAPLSLRFHPHHLAYFNLLAGGPLGGRYHLVDSNLDWGQDLYGLKTYIDQHHLEDIGLAYFGTVVPSTIGIRCHEPPSGFPRPGWYAISANFVQGRPHAIRNARGERIQVGIGEFAYFGFFEPVATIGYSIYVYRISDQDVRDYAAALRQVGH